MGASFAKAIFHRPPRKPSAPPASEWALGWSFPIKTDRAPKTAFLAPPLERGDLGIAPSHSNESNPEDRS